MSRLWLPLFVGIALVAGLFPSFSVAANLTVLVVGGAMVWLGLSGRMRRAAPRRLTRSALWWTVPLGLFATVELVNFAMGSTRDHPTASILTDPLLESYPARAALVLGWLLAFQALARR